MANTAAGEAIADETSGHVRSRTLRRTSSHGAQFAYGGVIFEILGDRLEWTLSPIYAALATSPAGTAGIAGHVQCAVTTASGKTVPHPAAVAERADRRLDEAALRTVQWAWDGDNAGLIAGETTARVRRLGRGRYAAAAEVADGPLGLSALCAGLSSLVVYREGGLNVHAAAVEIDGVAVLFIGPSGAGKTTAADLCEGARRIAHDRVAVIPSRTGWTVWGLAGGTDSNGLPFVDAPNLPLGAVLMVEQGGPVRIERMDPASALAGLRSMVQRPNVGTNDERSTLDAAMALIDSAPVGRVHTELGVSLSDTVRRFVVGEGVSLHAASRGRAH